jgi:hypothetical protein
MDDEYQGIDPTKKFTSRREYDIELIRSDPGDLPYVAVSSNGMLVNQLPVQEFLDQFVVVV